MGKAETPRTVNRTNIDAANQRSTRRIDPITSKIDTDEQSNEKDSNDAPRDELHGKEPDPRTNSAHVDKSHGWKLQSLNKSLTGRDRYSGNWEDDLLGII